MKLGFHMERVVNCLFSLSSAFSCGWTDGHSTSLIAFYRALKVYKDIC